LVIELKKISKSKKVFSIKRDDLVFSGEFYRIDNRSIVIDAKLTGKLNVFCVRTLEDFEKEIDEEFHFLIYDGEFKGFNKNYDVIESFDGLIDFDYILDSEIELIRDDYNRLDGFEDEFVYKED
jgi:uncharacterized metal-binding protein YceD (DUF177 family)